MRLPSDQHWTKISPSAPNSDGIACAGFGEGCFFAAVAISACQRLRDALHIAWWSPRPMAMQSGVSRSWSTVDDRIVIRVDG